MKKSTVGMIAGSTALLSAGTMMAVNMMKNNKEEEEQLSSNMDNKEDNPSPDIDNEARKDSIPSPDANEDEAEEGLTLLDHQYRSQWQANGFPQTHKAMRELEEDENDKEDK